MAVTIQLKQGRFYRTRIGSIVGPMLYRHEVATCGACYRGKVRNNGSGPTVVIDYFEDGTTSKDGTHSPSDILMEVSPEDVVIESFGKLSAATGSTAAGLASLASSFAKATSKAPTPLKHVTGADGLTFYPADLLKALSLYVKAPPPPADGGLGTNRKRVLNAFVQRGAAEAVTRPEASLLPSERLRLLVAQFDAAKARGAAHCVVDLMMDELLDIAKVVKHYEDKLRHEP